MVLGSSSNNIKQLSTKTPALAGVFVLGGSVTFGCDERRCEMALSADEFLRIMAERKPGDHVYGTCGVCHEPITDLHKEPREPLPRVGDELAHPDCYWGAFGTELEKHPIVPLRIHRGT